jgi:predicted metal-dependent hydrolase
LVIKRDENFFSEINLDYGDAVWFLGSRRPIRKATTFRVFFDGWAINMPANLDKIQMAEMLVDFYKYEASILISDAILKYSPIIGAEPPTVKVNGSKSKLSSCSEAGILNFSWRIALFEKSVLDYAVVCELAYMLHGKRSHEFRRAVSNVFPDYMQRKKMLKEFEPHTLVF